MHELYCQKPLRWQVGRYHYFSDKTVGKVFHLYEKLIVGRVINQYSIKYLPITSSDGYDIAH